MEKFLTVVVVVLAVIAVTQLSRVYDLARNLRKKREEEISGRDNNLNAKLLLGFMIAMFITFFAMCIGYGTGGLPVAASEHGAETDKLLYFNFAVIVAVFMLCNFLLFYFAYKYRYDKKRKAYYFPHDNRLELIWTVVPAVFLAVIIIYGLKTWNDITELKEDGDAIVIELYSEQFKWTARYTGEDGMLGDASYLAINNDNYTNPLGLLTETSVDSSIVSYQKAISELDSAHKYNEMLRDNGEKAEALEEAHRYVSRAGVKHMDGHHDAHADESNEGHGAAGHGHEEAHHVDYRTWELDKIEHELHTAEKHIDLAKNSGWISGDESAEEAEDRKARYIRIKNRLQGIKKRMGAGEYIQASDDIVVGGEFHIPVGKEIQFRLRAKDVIHSAYMPHFRSQMNTVPGMTTLFRMTPTITTTDMRKNLGDDEFDYVLLCNKICGAAHYNMQMKVVVDTPEDYEKWLKGQEGKIFGAKK